MNDLNPIYGPVHSRRLGFSLGVDLIPFKTCPFDCIYCQLGRTTEKTLRRANYVPVDRVLRDLKRSLEEFPEPDFITLAGSGEPTLHSGIGEILTRIRSLSSRPVAVLTNGVLLGDDDVRNSCSLADVVVPSLDAGTEEEYARVNRPVQSLTLRSMVDGLMRFRESFSGEMWLEVFLVRGITDDDDAVKRIAHLAAGIRPDRVHLNTAVRPTAEDSVLPVSSPDLERFAAFFNPKALIAFDQPSEKETPGIHEEKLTESLKRRPATIEEIGEILQASPVNVIKIMDRMVRKNQVKIIRREGIVHYTAVP
jgi:wyosine [tRNA(Phe)-imidazoG37] synthetase (radical SAM superfamily)